jgi:hypothetical protein
VRRCHRSVARGVGDLRRRTGGGRGRTGALGDAIGGARVLAHGLHRVARRRVTGIADRAIPVATGNALTRAGVDEARNSFGAALRIG